MAKALASSAHKAVGIKQTLRALSQGKALRVYLAQDADQELLEAIIQTAESQSVPVVRVPTMKELGQYCGIQVPAAAAALTSG